MSDIDLFVVVDDLHIEAIVAEREAYVAQPGRPILLLEAPQNAPPGGAYLMALYEGQSGPHQIDWYWQARSAARIPQETVVLFDRVGLLLSDGPARFSYQPVPEVSPLEAVNRAVSGFWVGLLITAKYAVRSPWEERMGLLEWPRGALADVQRFAGVAPRLPDETPQRSPEEKVAILRELARQMEGLMPRMDGLGARVPSEIAPQARCYLDLIEVLVRSPSDRSSPA